MAAILGDGAREAPAESPVKRFSVRWTEPAVADLTAIRAYIATENPAGATRIARALIEAGESLQGLARRGRPGRASGTRELVITGLPWIVVYQVGEAEVTILRVLHGARKPTPELP